MAFSQAEKGIVLFLWLYARFASEVGEIPLVRVVVTANFNSNFSPFTPKATKTLLTALV